MNREAVLTEHLGGVALITMNRPEKRNAFNDQQYDDLRAALTDARDDDAIKAVVLTGAPGAFSGGQDLGEMATARTYSDGQRHGFAPFIDCLSSFDKPLIAAVNGVGVGIGLTMLLHCDMVYIARSARLRAPFVSLGLVPEAASSYLLQAIVGPQLAAELLYTNAWIGADRAVELKLAAAVYADDALLAGAMGKASEIAQQPLASLRRTKQTLLAVREDAVAAARRREDAAMAASLGGRRTWRRSVRFVRSGRRTSAGCSGRPERSGPRPESTMVR